MRALPYEDVAVTLSPYRLAAPVGSEVALLAGVRGGDGFLRTNQRLEWSIAPGGVGQFVAVQQNHFVDYLVGDFTRPRKITTTLAVGSTSRRSEQVGQGPNPADRVVALPGQGWITVTSPIEGTSHVMVYAPDVVVCNARVQSATIHWIDAAFGYPPPSIDPAGSRHMLTTTVVRQSNQGPHAGWLVRYEIAGGPPAGFAGSGAPVVEVPTNAAGQASAEIVQQQPAHGTNQIRIQVIRPAEMGGPGGEKLVVGTGSTLQTWTAAALTVSKVGPATAAVGATLTYRIEVSNSGDLPAKEVTASDEVPDALAFVSATPSPVVNGKRLQWQLGELGPGQRRVLEATFRAVQAGSVVNCAELSAAGGIRASQCATTTIVAPTLDLRVTGPEQVAVGGQVTFQIVVTNWSQVPATGLTIKDRFGDGLEHVVARSPIERSLKDLAPGQSQRVDVTFTATRAGQLCHTVEISATDGVRATAQGCVTAVATSNAPPPAAPPGPAVPPGPTAPPPGPAVQSAPSAQPPLSSPLAVRETGPQQATVGQLVDFSSDVTNISAQTVTNVRVVHDMDAAMLPEMATDGYHVEGNSLVWTIPSLPPNTPVHLRVQGRCKKAAPRACSHVSAMVAGSGPAEDQVCLEILAAAPGPGPAPAVIAKPAPGPAPAQTKPDGLTLTIADLNNPVAAGKEVTYLVRVTNQGTAADNQIVLTATAPAGTTIAPLGTSGPDPTRYNIVNQVVRFDPVGELKSGQTLVYRIRIQTGQSGSIRMHVEVTSRNHPAPVTGEKATDIIPSRE